MVSDDVISMPDKWEYPWYAAWDLAFHSIPLALVDPDFAKKQLLLLLQERYLHPNGQVPASEWNFGDVNPPVHAWAAYFLYQIDRRRTGHPDLEFLRNIYNKLLLNFTWWVNRKDLTGRNVFEGGFLGLDNVGVFDRSAPLPTGGHLEQADGTAWMAFYAQTMLQISLELALDDRSYVDMALKFFEHFVWIASAMIHIGGKGEMWDEEDGFFYDVLRTPDGRAQQLKVRSMVGLLPLCAATVVDEDVMAALPELQQRARLVREQSAPPGQQHSRPAAARLPQPAVAVAAQRRAPAPRARPPARRERVPEPVRDPVALPSSPRHPYDARRRRSAGSGSATCRPSRTARCSAATRTGAARSGCRSTVCWCGPSSTTTATTAPTSRWSARPDRGAAPPCTRSRRR